MEIGVVFGDRDLWRISFNRVGDQKMNKTGTYLQGLFFYIYTYIHITLLGGYTQRGMDL